MEENEINQRLTNDELYDSAEYNNKENSEFITFKKGENSFINEKYIGNPSNEISPIKFSNPIYTRPLHSIDNYNKERFTYNYNNRNQYSNNSMPVNVIRNDNYVNRKTYVNKSQDFSPYFYNNKTSTYKNYHNRSQIYNGNTTDEGDSYINPNRDSNYYNHPNQNKKMYLGVPMDYPLEEKIDNNNNISDYSNEEQLIIYPEKKYIFVNEKYFNKKSNEGILKPKNLETYEVKSIEYIPDEQHKYKSISLGDYILKKGNKNRMRKNKSCTNININNIKNDSEKEYDIKVLSNIKKERGKKIITSDIINSIKLIKDKYDTKKQINNINIIRNRDNTDDNFSFDEINKNINKGGIVDLSDKKKYNTSFIRERKYNINNREYPDWKILASACLIQSWFRSLKRLKNSYKRNLQKIIIIQKVYKMHYKNKILSSKRKPNIYKNYKKEPSEDYNNKLYKNKDYLTYMNNYTKQSLPKYKKTIPIIYNSNSDESNPNYRNNNLKIYNRPSIPKINNNFSYKDKTINKGTYFVPKSFRYYDAQYNIALLLIEKIIENKILKTYFDFLFNLKNYTKKDIKSDDNTSKPAIKINLGPTKIKRIKNKTNPENKNNKKEDESNNENNIVINDKDKYNFNSKQKFLLKKLFIRIWLRQAMKLKNAKRTHWKDRFKNKEKKHILLKGINKFVLDKIKQEVKRRKLIVSFNIINTKKYPNLKYALKKIKKYAKVRYNVLNNFASIIQNAFRFYLENKNKEGK